MTIKLDAIRPKKYQLIDMKGFQYNVSHDTEAYLNSVRKQMQSDYGRVPASPRYQRTHTLSRGWQVEMDSNGFGGTLYNDVPYAVYAQGPRRHGERNAAGGTQATAMRRRGWRSITDVAAQVKRDYTLLVNKRIKGSFTG